MYEADAEPPLPRLPRGVRDLSGHRSALHRPQLGKGTNGSALMGSL